MAQGSSRSRLVRIALAVGLTVLALFAQTTPVHAAENEGWGVYPTNTTGGTQRNQFVLDLVPGVTVNESITITNKTAQPVAFRVLRC